MEPATESQLVLSERCSAGSTVDWDGSPGSPTRRAAIESELDFLQTTLERLPSDGQRSEDFGLLKDRVRLSVAIRGLTAVSEGVETAEQGASSGDFVEIIAHLETGQELARAQVEAAASGGYRLTQYTASGWTSDDPTCD